MRERAILLVVAGRAARLEIRGTELGFVLIWVVKLFNSVMCLVAAVTLGTILPLPSHVWTDFRLISAQRSAPVLVIIVVIGAPFEIVTLRL